MSQKKLLLLIFGLLLAGVVAAMINADQHIQPSDPVDAPKTEQAQDGNIHGESVSFTVTEGERKKWTIDAKHAVYFQDHSGATLKDITGRFYDANGKPVLAFTAPEGEYKTKDQQVVLTGGVKAHSIDTKSDGLEPTPAAASGSGKAMSLTAPKMSWSARTDWVIAEGGVHLVHGSMGQSDATRCRFTLDMSSIALEGNVSSKMDL